MKPGIPWSVKGINTEAKEAAKQAARRSGVTLGEWLNNVILDQAESVSPESAPSHSEPVAESDDLQSRLGELAAQLSRLAGREQDTAAGRYNERRQSPEADNRALQGILARLEANERETVEALATVNERISALAQNVPEKTAQRPEDVPGFRALESALRNIVNHVEVTEKRTREDIQVLHDQLGDIVQTPAGPDSELEARLVGLTDRLARTEEETQTLRALPAAMESELGKLGQRIDQVRQSSEASALKAQAAAMQSASKDLREVEARFQTFMREQQAALKAQASGPDANRLRGDIDSINQRIDDLKADAASERDLHALRVAFEQLSTRVAQGPDLRPLADLDRRLADIAKRVEQNQGADPRALAALEGRIATMSDRIGKTEAQLSHLTTLEQSINQLFDSLEQSRLWAREMADDAAARMGDQLMKSPQFNQPAPSGPSPELQALEQGLQAVRQSAAYADKRNQETLEAVHETLEQIVDRLAEIETAGKHGEAPKAASYEPQASTWQDTIAPGPAHSRESYATRREQSWQDSISPAPAREAFTVRGEALRVDPFEFNRPAPQPEPVQAQAETAPVPQLTAEPAPKIAPEEDFIAAARRAAQAAAQQSPGPLSSRPGIDRARTVTAVEPAPRRFSLPFLNRKRNTDTPAAGTVSAKEPTDTKRRNLLIAGLTLLVAAAGYVASNYVPLGPPPATQGSLIQDPAPAVRKAETQAAPAKETAAQGDEVLGRAFPVSATGDVLPDGIHPKNLRLAAEQGDPEAQFIVAGRFLEGRGVLKDERRAADLYQSAAAKGLAPAQYRIGTLFERGRGVPQDNVMARTWYERAAALGNVKSMHNAAVIYAGNEAGKPDYVKAAALFTEAAEYNLKDSQFNLAVLYERGLGVKQSMADALFWYSIAAGQDDADAGAKAKSLEKVMAPSTVDDVKSRIKTWTPKAPTAEANLVKVSDPSWQEETAAAAVYEAPLLGAAVDLAVQQTAPVQEAQQLLNDLGFDAGAADGRMGTRTTNAIRLFQLQSGMKVTGEVSDDLIAKLRSKRG
ncbi:peptidoglycan-binding protein [soil metagenome]